MKNAKATTNKKREQALDAFLARIQASRELLARITAHLDDHLGVDPEHVNWANVGDAGYIQELLAQICEFQRIPELPKAKAIKTYPVRRDDGRVVKVTIPED